MSINMKPLFAAAVLAAAAAPAWAAPHTATLSIPTMHCAMCPVTVKAALSKVAGVSQVRVNLDKRQAVVTFDDAKTTVQQLTEATKDAGYPARVVASRS